MTKPQTVNTPFGPGTARHSRGAPYLQSQDVDYGGARLGDTYKEFVRGLRNGKPNDASHDQEIAKDLLEGTQIYLTTDLQKRAAMMIVGTGYLAEQWRKQGAEKVFRAILRANVDGKCTFDTLPKWFHFVKSADAGRKQVGQFQDVYEGQMKQLDLKSDERQIYGYMSDIEKDDMSSDSEMRGRKTLKKKRLYALKHNPPEPDSDSDSDG